jgi:hypothetical protein
MALLAGLALTALALGVTLSGAPSTVAGTNSVALSARLGQTKGAVICQPAELLPADTSAVRLSLEATVGPRVTVLVFAGKRLLTSGTRGSGWTAASVTVPVQPLNHAATGSTRLCFEVEHTRLAVGMLGAPAKQATSARLLGGRLLHGRIAVEYLRAGRASWWSLALSVARRMGLGRATAGTWITLVVLALMLGLTLLVSWLTIRELGFAGQTMEEPAPADLRRRRVSVLRRVPALRHVQIRRCVPALHRLPVLRRVSVLRRVPAAAWACALVACVNAVCWSVITPPFQAVDEPNHFAYVQLLAQNGQLPSPNLPEASPAMQIVLNDLESDRVRYAPQRRSLSSAAQQRLLERDMAAPLSRRGAGGAGAAYSEPPLYYGLELFPYELGSDGSLLERLELMRLLSALMAAATALFAYLFVREALPSTRWAWTVGGLAVAVFPLLGFISGGVTPDAMLFAVCTAIYYCLARAFRRGLTPRLALLIGLLTATGFATKLNFVGFAPGAILGLIVLTVRSARRGKADRTTAKLAGYRYGAIGLAIALSPVALYASIDVISGRPVLSIVSRTLEASSGPITHELSYIWQFYLPRLPGMMRYFPGILTTRQLWFDGLVGLYGWADTLFPGWVYDLALVPGGLIAVLCLRELVRARAALRRRIPELAIYGSMAVGVLGLVGAQSYVSDAIDHFEPFWEPRYLLPMLALWGLVVALAARGAGRRWGPAVGALLIVLLLTHDIVSQLQVVARYYG